MSTAIGRDLARAIQAELAAEVQALRAQGYPPPGLAVVLVGDDPASLVYVRNKSRACNQVGIVSSVHHLPRTTTEAEVVARLAHLGADASVHGILVQLPLPAHIDETKVIEALSPDKDVDGFHPLNVARLFTRQPFLVPSTPAGIVEFLHRQHIAIAGKQAVIISASRIVGKPLALMLLNEGAAVTVCHIYTRDLAAITREADLLVSAAGKVKLVTADMVKPGSVVVDVGINFHEGKTVGDVDAAAVAPRVALLTPVPGGVGPVTVAMLLRNTLLAYKHQLGLLSRPDG
ncbi:MAG: bifunctional protein FolD [Candidatus Tectimicrobiota bacterium]|nr:MAG: bifunctional protein FolD [Candidatus Tectomicrobia bacterium]